MIELIPAIDIIGGKCVRLTKGDYNTKTIYDYSPLDLAKNFEDLGFKRLHIVDLDGAKAGKVTNADILYQIATKTNLVVDFGGGIRQSEDMQRVLDNGAHFVTIGSLAVKQAELFLSWITQYGAERFILGADCRKGRIAINGWLEEAQELLPFVQEYWNKGLRHILCTDIDQDGMLTGTNIALYCEMMQHFPACHLIASGGVASMEDIVALEEAGIPAVVFGKAIYEGRIDLAALMDWHNNL